jgi:very-short-patch-repair endonuclease
MNNHYNSNLRNYAYELRTESVSRAEKYLWRAVLSRIKQGVKFKRQRPIGNYIVDFFSQEIGLIIEIDGSSHSNKGVYDRQREDILISLGYHLIRFPEGDVIQDVDVVGGKIQNAIYILLNKD